MLVMLPVTGSWFAGQDVVMVVLVVRDAAMSCERRVVVTRWLCSLVSTKLCAVLVPAVLRLCAWWACIPYCEGLTALLAGSTCIMLQVGGEVDKGGADSNPVKGTHSVVHAVAWWGRHGCPTVLQQTPQGPSFNSCH
jgi:hypothetical protein